MIRFRDGSTPRQRTALVGTGTGYQDTIPYISYSANPRGNVAGTVDVNGYSIMTERLIRYRQEEGFFQFRHGELFTVNPDDCQSTVGGRCGGERELSQRLAAPTAPGGHLLATPSIWPHWRTRPWTMYAVHSSSAGTRR